MSGGVVVGDANDCRDWRLIFGDCIRHILKSWSALNFAIYHGGSKAEEKRSLFYSELVTLFASNDKLTKDKYLLADWLNDKMFANFDIELEDESDTEIASLICDLYSTLSQGDNTIAIKILKTPERNSVNNQTSLPSSSSDDDDDEETDINDTKESTTTAVAKTA